MAAYTKALEFSLIDSHLLYSNRSAVYLTMKDFENALADAKKCIEAKPDWSKVRRLVALEFIADRDTSEWEELF